jgi:exonuclease III
MSYIILRGRWCDIIVLNVHAPTEDKIDDIKDRFYEELKQVFDKFRNYPMKLLLGDFNAKVGREDIFKPVVPYGCETWSVTLREERKLRMFEKRVLRRIFRPRRDEVKGDWRKLHNEELHNLYSSSNIIRIIKSRRMRRTEHAARMGRRGMRIGYWWESQKERDH